jgi:hypothetical protein
MKIWDNAIIKRRITDMRIAVRQYSDLRWTLIWIGGLLAALIWSRLFLNYPAFSRLLSAMFNSLWVAVLAVLFSFILGYGATLLQYSLQKQRIRTLEMLFIFALNLIRSVPQIIGLLSGYIWIALMIEERLLASRWLIIILFAAVTALFIFSELFDLLRERIAHYKKSDFFDAMVVCGISESRIINFDIFWKNSRTHILNKLIAVFAAAIFLQCSVDFIISVGLSTDVAAVNLPPTLGSMLAKLDSKQDILAIGYSLGHPGYLTELLFTHLQGITIAFVIVFSLLSLNRIGAGFAERKRL